MDKQDNSIGLEQLKELVGSNFFVYEAITKFDNSIDEVIKDYILGNMTYDKKTKKTLCKKCKTETPLFILVDSKEDLLNFLHGDSCLVKLAKELLVGDK